MVSPSLSCLGGLGKQVGQTSFNLIQCRFLLLFVVVVSIVRQSYGNLTKKRVAIDERCPNLFVKTLAQIVKVNTQFLVSLVPFSSKNKGFLLILEGAFCSLNLPLSVDQIVGVECVLAR